MGGVVEIQGGGGGRQARRKIGAFIGETGGWIVGSGD